jgi:hypothetical protein
VQSRDPTRRLSVRPAEDATLDAQVESALVVLGADDEHPAGAHDDVVDVGPGTGDPAT